jgi:hypothetical protein
MIFKLQYTEAMLFVYRVITGKRYKEKLNYSPILCNVSRALQNSVI